MESVIALLSLAVSNPTAFWTLLITSLGGPVGAAVFFIRTGKKLKELDQMRTDLDSLKNDVKELEANAGESFRTLREEIRTELKESRKELIDRIDRLDGKIDKVLLSRSIDDK